MHIRFDNLNYLNCVFLLHTHLVFITKYRKDIFSEKHLQYLEENFKYICCCFECELVEFNGESDHVHLLINFPPKVASFVMAWLEKKVNRNSLEKRKASYKT